jgi:hypothetical protein
MQLPTSQPLPVLAGVEKSKQLAAFAAVDRHIGLKDRVSAMFRFLGAQGTTGGLHPFLSATAPLGPGHIRPAYPVVASLAPEALGAL